MLSGWWPWAPLLSGLWRRVVWYKNTAYLFRVEERGKAGSTKKKKWWISTRLHGVTQRRYCSLGELCSPISSKYQAYYTMKNGDRSQNYLFMRDLISSLCRCWRFEYYGIWCRVTWQAGRMIVLPSYSGSSNLWTSLSWISETSKTTVETTRCHINEHLRFHTFFL